MNRLQPSCPHWQLPDLLDFEALVMTGAAVDARERLIFDRDIRPLLSNMPERQRRARGLRLWLQSRRDREEGRIWPGQAWIRTVQLVRWFVFLTSIVAGGG